MLSVDISVDGTLSPPAPHRWVGWRERDFILPSVCTRACFLQILDPFCLLLLQPLKLFPEECHGLLGRAVHSYMMESLNRAWMCASGHRVHVPRSCAPPQQRCHQEPGLSSILGWPEEHPLLSYLHLVSIIDICVYGFCSPHKSWMVHEYCLLIGFLFFPSLKGFAGIYQIYSLHYNLISQDQ